MALPAGISDRELQAPRTPADTSSSDGYVRLAIPLFPRGRTPMVNTGSLTMIGRLGAMFERTASVRSDEDLQHVLWQVARTIGMGLTGDALPQRLSYRTSVFRYEPEHAGRGREIFQVGAELVGVDDVSGDYEIISLLIECLQAIGLGSVTIALGHVGFIKGLLMRSGLSPQGQKRAEQAAAKKDLPRLEELLAGERIAKSAAKAIREAPELTGQEEVLERGRVLAAGDPALLAPLDRLSQLYHLLCASWL